MSLTVPGTSATREGLRDCVAQIQCFVPGKHHTISAGLFASLLESDLSPVQEWAATEKAFVMIQWGLGPRAPPRFLTRFVVTQDSGPYIRFTTGLERERRLDAYTRKLESVASAQRSSTMLTSDVDTSQHGPDSRHGWESSVDRRHTTGLEPYGDSIPSEAQDFPIILPENCDSRPLPVGSPHTDRSMSQSGILLTGQVPTPRATPPPPDINPPPHGQQARNVAVNQQLLDETLYREWRDAEITFQQTGDMTEAQKLLPPSMDGARTVGPTGSPWVWSSDFLRWYWVDRNGQRWWS